MSKALLLAAPFLLLALAGCSGGGGGGDGSTTTGTTGPIKAGKGAIAGLLVDDRFRPIPDGDVLLSNGLTAKADANGEFVFQDLDPGQYTARVQAAGHEAAPTIVNVAEGVYNELEIIARRVLNEGSRIITTEYSAFVSCNVNAVVIGLPYDCTADMSGDTDRAAFYSNYTSTQNVTYMVTEMKANRVGNYEVRIRPTDHDQGPDGNYAVMEIVDSDYMKIVNQYGVAAEGEYALTGNNAPWNNTDEFLTILYVDSIGKDAGGTGTFGVGVDVGIRARFIQSVFVGEPEVDIESYAVLA
jgi:hypothetical protein